MRGRPLKSPIRQNIVELLLFLKQGYGYEIVKHYLAVFPKVAQRSVYYHLKKGLKTGEFVVHEIKEEKGHFSWGPYVEKVYYGLGPNAKPLMPDNVKVYMEKLKR
jgi:hypothetical protein